MTISIMKKIKQLAVTLLFIIMNISVFGQGSIITEEPQIESSNTKEAQIDKVELTDKYTIVYMSFELDRNSNATNRSKKGGRILKDLLDILMNGNMGGQGASSKAYIAIRPSSNLVALNGDRIFKYIKASGIPEEPRQLDVYAGEKVNFKVYYERIDPGITQFDFFEGYNSDQVRCWNYYKVHIINPIKKEVQPENTAGAQALSSVFFIKGRVLDSQTNKPVNAKLEYLLSPKMEAIDSTMTYWNTGNYKTTLPTKGIYNCIVSAQGYLVKQETIELTAENVNNSITKDIYLTPISKGDIVRLNNVYFETSQFELLSASYSELNKLVTLMQENPEMRILLEGHTDIIGDKQANIELSQNRVISVKNYLINKGIDPKRIETKGWGSSKPLNANGTDDERKVNRRVEFRVLSI
jgi:OmpA-OmpF porin, OOP family